MSPTRAEIDARTKRYVVAGAVVVALAASVLMSGRGPNKPYITQAEFKKELLAAENDCVPILARHDGGADLTSADRQALSAVAARLDTLANYSQDPIATTFLSGKIHQVLGNGQTAEKRLRLCITSILKAPSTPALKLTLTEAHYLLSRVYFDRGMYSLALTEADIAVQAIPNSPLYHVARASAHIQMNHLKDARSDVAVALKLDPKNRWAIQLKSLLK